jgi:hypothetical protein
VRVWELSLIPIASTLAVTEVLRPQTAPSRVAMTSRFAGDTGAART